jgi:serine/threonine-protein kinase/endoribonuclease IRE1
LFGSRLHLGVEHAYGLLYSAVLWPQVQLLIKTDNHNNVVRYFATEESDDFVYVVLELCSRSLAVAVTKCAHHRRTAAERKYGPELPRRVPLELALILTPPPSDATRRFLYELTAGVAHLHQHNIVHRDLKPHNILLSPLHASEEEADSELITGKPRKLQHHDHHEHHRFGVKWRAKISDMGLSKQLLDGASSFSASFALTARTQSLGDSSSSSDDDTEASSSTTTGPATNSSSLRVVGTAGWQPPELLALTPEGRLYLETVDSDDTWTRVGGGRRDGVGTIDAKELRRKTRSIDVWALGCVVFHVVHAGGHPYGSDYARNTNILRGDPVDLEKVSHLPDVFDLISRMIHRQPAERPKARQVLEHPFFWSDDKRLAFLQV